MVSRGFFAFFCIFILSTTGQAGDIQSIKRVMTTPLGQAIMYLPEWEILSRDLLGSVKAVPRTGKSLSVLLKALDKSEVTAQAHALAERLLKIESEFAGLKGTLSMQDHARLEKFVQRELQIDASSPLNCRSFLRSGTVLPKFAASEWFPGDPAKVPPGVDSHYVGSRKVLPFSFPGMHVASIEDSTFSTGATVFFFDKGAIAAYDSRGGSVASVETTLFDQGSYSADIDAVAFAGGSSMGLAVADGVRQALFRARAGKGSDFDSIPSAPGAVVYDYSSRIYSHHDAGIYPTAEMGAAAMERLSSSFILGRAGAGLNTTVNKHEEDSKRIWGGQGAAFSENPWGRMFVAVILNASGDVQVAGESISKLLDPIVALAPKKAGQNTTLSLIVTDAPIDRNALKRLSVMVHTNMASVITPFQTYGDGDINFAVTTNKTPKPFEEDTESKMQSEALRLMRRAIVEGSLTANRASEQTIKTVLKKLK